MVKKESIETEKRQNTLLIFCEIGFALILFNTLFQIGKYSWTESIPSIIGLTMLFIIWAKNSSFTYTNTSPM